MKHLLAAAAMLLFSTFAIAADNPRVLMRTSMGEIRLELDAAKAPVSTENFLQYVNQGFYNGTIFHRVIPDFMIQGGGLTADLQKKPTGKPIQNEARNGLKNVRGSVAMARTNDPHSATSQFFINHADNAFLDDRGERGWGYAVFGKVVDGMDVVDKIAASETGIQGGRRDVPIETITIESVTLVE